MQEVGSKGPSSLYLVVVDGGIDEARGEDQRLMSVAVHWPALITTCFQKVRYKKHSVNHHIYVNRNQVDEYMKTRSACVLRSTGLQSAQQCIRTKPEHQKPRLIYHHIHGDNGHLSRPLTATQQLATSSGQVWCGSQQVCSHQSSIQSLLSATTALVSKPIILTSDCPYSEGQLQSECSGWFPIALSLH